MVRRCSPRLAERRETAAAKLRSTASDAALRVKHRVALLESRRTMHQFLGELKHLLAQHRSALESNCMVVSRSVGQARDAEAGYRRDHGEDVALMEYGKTLATFRLICDSVRRKFSDIGELLRDAHIIVKALAPPSSA